MSAHRMCVRRALSLFTFGAYKSIAASLAVMPFAAQPE
jgi:hypothetical protein